MNRHPRNLALRARPLTVAFALAFGVAASSAPHAQASPRQSALHHADISPASRHGGGIRVVDACSEAALRQAIVNAADGDTIDLAMGCSAITLTAGAIPITVDNLTLVGPGADMFTLYGGGDSGNYDRVFRHYGTGTFEIDGATIADAKSYNSIDPRGGCIDSDGTVYLKQAVLANCYIGSAPNLDAEGGAVFAQKGAKLYESRISGSEAYSVGALSKGGAIYSLGDLDIEHSTISDNVALSTVSTYSTGGGIAVFYANATVMYSTISGNQASRAAGLSVDGNAAYSATIVDSTISGNHASYAIGGAAFNTPTTIYNSTITLNTSVNTFLGVGVYAADSLTADSSIFSNNLTPAGDLGMDIYASGGMIGGGKDIIVLTPNTVPQDTIKICPRLGPLADNGGPTFTHALLSGSPAIDAGSNDLMLSFDQRLAGFDRSFGASADIGAYEWQGNAQDEILLSRFEFGCD